MFSRNGLWKLSHFSIKGNCKGFTCNEEDEGGVNQQASGGGEQVEGKQQFKELVGDIEWMQQEMQDEMVVILSLMLSIHTMIFALRSLKLSPSS
ncbi:hypothetical protein AMTR_s00036p00236490 [Amborella trichopoda]|uniref:Uncharacterized protein n=1 Tax=Amborella trichopoda TaxID=13333 RepID=U5CQL0_AMBTC|nr:hypothetical protein AMTR_s00036p00236490 [Amborella trichopoda]